MTDELRKAADELADAVSNWGQTLRGSDAERASEAPLWDALDAYRAAATKEAADAERKADAARRRSWR